MTIRLHPLLAAVPLLLAAPTLAQEHGVAFAGGTTGRAPSVYVGGAVALPGATLGRGPAVRAGVGFNDYQYDAASSRIRARETTATLAGVYQWSGGWGYLNLAAGGIFRDTRLRPDDPGNANRGSQWDAVVGADGARLLGRWRLVGLASYQFDLREYYARVDATVAVTRPLRLGVEAVAQGNPDYHRQLYGAVVYVVPAPKWELRLSSGALVQRRENSGYVSFGISRVF